MGYDAKAVRQRVALHPWVSPFVTPMSWRVVRTLKQLRPSHTALAKAEA